MSDTLLDKEEEQKPDIDLVEPDVPTRHDPPRPSTGYVYGSRAPIGDRLSQHPGLETRHSVHELDEEEEDPPSSKRLKVE